MTNINEKIGNKLVEARIINFNEYEKALNDCISKDEPITDFLINEFYVTRSQLEKLLTSEELELVANIKNHIIEDDLLKVLPEDFVRTNKVIPLSIDKKRKRIVIATNSSDNYEVLDQIALLCGYRPVPQLTSDNELENLLKDFVDLLHSQ